VRTNIDIDDGLMRGAQRASGQTSKKATVEQGLRLLIRAREQQDILALAGKVDWSGDLALGRDGRFVD
jgi:Arc/MetJ family transcription regulator